MRRGPLWTPSPTSSPFAVPHPLPETHERRCQMKRVIAFLAALVFAGSGTAQAEDVTAQAWNPPSNLVQPLDEVWRHQEATYGNLYGFRNYGWDQIMANRGYVNYCV